jgi:tetratricopeptide (TPR) repeat protein
LNLGKPQEAIAALDESIERTTGVCDFVRALCMVMKGMVVFMGNDARAGRDLVREGLRIQDRIGDHEGGGIARSFLAQMSFVSGELRAALEMYTNALVSFEKIGDRPEIARVHCEMGWTALAASDHPAAMTAFRRAVQSYEEVGSPRGTGLALLGIAAVEAAEGRAERAVAIAAAARALTERAGVVVDYPMDPMIVQRIEALKSSIPQGALEDLVARSRELTPAEVLSMVESM